MTVVLTALTTTAAWAQKINVTGTVIEKETSEAVMAATVQLLQTKDSTMAAGVATDANGAFSLQNVKKGSYILKVTFIGYEPRIMPLDLTKEKGKKVDLGYITLSTDAKMLREAVVTAQAAKVQVKGDSLVFNADAYRVAEGSVLEDLVKKLPGATVEEDGTIKINTKDFCTPAAHGDMSAKERAYFVMGNLAAAYHNGHNKANAYADGNTVMLGQQPIITCNNSDESASVLADRLNKIK
jgi:hypothetical protein